MKGSSQARRLPLLALGGSPSPQVRSRTFYTLKLSLANPLADKAGEQFLPGRLQQGLLPGSGVGERDWSDVLWHWGWYRALWLWETSYPASLSSELAPLNTTP